MFYSLSKQFNIAYHTNDDNFYLKDNNGKCLLKIKTDASLNQILQDRA